jgi:hypothetical protein
MRVQQRASAILVRSEMQVGEQCLAFAHPVVFDGDRLLDLQDQLSLAPHVFRLRDNGCPGCGELAIGDRRTQTRPGFDEDRMPMPGELVHTRRSDGHPVFVVLDLGRNSNQHPGSTPFLWPIASI